MKLLVIVLCLLSERFFIHSISYQRFSWFNDYALRIKKQVDNKAAFANPWMLFAAIILPIIILTAFIYLLLHRQLYGFLGMLINLVICFYCLGPQNTFYPLVEEGSGNDEGLIKHYFAQANTQLFSLLFWYVIAGPVIALAYRLITLCEGFDPVSPQAKQVKDVVEWIPTRITALLYLLVGNFQKGFTVFLKYLVAKPEDNPILLGECGINAARAGDKDEVTLINAEILVEHATIVLLVFIALFTLGAWL